MLTPVVGTPHSPQMLTLSSTPANSNAIAQVFYTMHATIDTFYRVDGEAASANGTESHFLPGGGTVDLYAEPNTVVSAVSANGAAGYVYITEWRGLGV